MEKEFSKTWISSKKPSKQRKYRAQAPNHIKRKLISSHISKELRAKHKRRNVVTVIGDKVKVLTGEYRGKVGNVSKVDTKKMVIYVEDVNDIKKDGSKRNIPIDPSNVVILELNLKDKKRQEAIKK